MKDVNIQKIFTANYCKYREKPYLCNVFFMVLDLRLIKIGCLEKPYLCNVFFMVLDLRLIKIGCLG